MNIVDIVIILLILSMGLTGLRRGVIKQLVTTVGFIIVVILAFYLKNPLAEFLSLHLPFFKFGVATVASFNILLYQGIAFLLVVLILEGILGIIIKISGVIERVLKMTIVLGIPSKILGFIVGIIEGFVVMFLVLFIVCQPQFNIGLVKDSALAKPILDSTPILSNVASGMVSVIDDSYDLILEYKDQKIGNNELDLKTIKTMLDHKVVTPKYIRKLIDNNKINLSGVDSLINQYDN